MNSRLSALHKLARKVPQLATILAILNGDFSSLDFDHWAEQVLAELLYKTPNIRPSDLHIRAQEAMQAFDDTVGNQMVLSVMKGNAPKLVELLHETGGGSGAALPAVVVRQNFVSE